MASRKTGRKRTTGRKRSTGSKRPSTPKPKDLCVQKQGSGARAYWLARHEDEIAGTVDQSLPEARCYRVRGTGNTADNAIRDWQEQWRRCMRGERDR